MTHRTNENYLNIACRLFATKDLETLKISYSYVNQM